MAIRILLLVVVLTTTQIPDSQEADNDAENSRIFDGRLAKEGEFPFMVAIFKFNEFVCSASMISDKTVLTAAHCVVKSMNPPTNKTYHPTTFKIGYGSLDLRGMRKMSVVKVFAKGSPLKADVAILWTKFKFPVCIGTISLPKQHTEFAGGTKIQLAGWGDLNSVQSTNLLHTTESVLTDDIKKCSKEPSIFFKSTRLCGEKLNGSGLCGGDSGGPAIVTIHGEPVVVGINSYIREACDTIPPKQGLVFVKASLYTNWLFEFSNGGKPNVVEPCKSYFRIIIH